MKVTSHMSPQIWGWEQYNKVFICIYYHLWLYYKTMWRIILIPHSCQTPQNNHTSSGWDGIHDDNHCWKKRASSNWSPIHSPKKLKLLALVQAIGLWLKKGGTKRPKFGNVCMHFLRDWYFWATLMLLLAFLEAMAATLVTSGGIPLSESQIGPAAMVFSMFSCLFQALSMKHDPTRSLSSRTVKNWTWFSSNWMMSKWCGSALLLEAACGGDPRRYI